MQEFRTYTTDNQYFTPREGDVITAISGMVYRLHIRKIAPLIHYAETECEPDLIDPHEVTIQPLKRNSQTMAFDDLEQDLLDSFQDLPIEPELALPVTVIGQVKWIDHGQFSGSRSGKSREYDGYILVESADETHYRTFKLFFNRRQTG